MKQMIQIASVLFAVCAVYAQSPNSMNYQGRIVDGSTLPSGPYSITFRIYDDPTAGSLCFLEHDPVTVVDGFYSTELGNNPEAKGSLGGGEPQFDNLPELLANGGTLYLELEVGGTVLSPRERILSTAYAMVAGEALGVANGSITGADIANGSITSSDIANGTILSIDLSNQARSTLDGANGAVEDAVVVDNDGSVGIGTDSPAAAMHVEGGEDMLDPVLRSVMEDNTGAFSNLSRCYGTALSGDHLFVASYDENSISVVNVANPDSPSLVTVLEDGVGGFNYLGGVYWLAVEGNYLYAGSYNEDAVSIINISTPSSPTLVTTLVDGIAGYNYLDTVAELVVRDGLLFIPSDYDDAVTIVDVSSPAAPSLEAVLVDGIGGYNYLNSVWAVDCEDDYLYIAARNDSAITIVDISTPSSPQLEAVISDGTGGYNLLNYPRGIAVSDSYAYIAAENALTVVDCTSPSAPVLVAEIPNGTGGFNQLSTFENVDVAGSRLFASATWGVTVADISDPAQPLPIAELFEGVNGFDDLYGTQKVTVDGNRIYISAYSDDAVTIADVSSAYTDGTAGLYVANRVGINTPLPRAALDVRGDIIVSGDIIAEDDVLVEDDLFLKQYAGGDHGRNVRMSATGYLYPGGSKSTYTSIPPSAFRPSNDGTGVNAYAFTYARMASGSTAMYAPVQLPHGADIYNVIFYYYDGTAAATLTMVLRRQAFDSTGYTVISQEASSGSGGYGYVYDYPSSNDVVDNMNYTYHIAIYPTVGSWSSSLRFMGCRVYYSIED